MSTTRQIIPKDIHQLVQQLKPVVSPESKTMDIIRIALVEMKKSWLLQGEKISINDPRHPYYSKATPEEEEAIEEALQEYKAGNCTILEPDQDVTELFGN